MRINSKGSHISGIVFTVISLVALVLSSILFSQLIKPAQDVGAAIAMIVFIVLFLAAAILSSVLAIIALTLNAVSIKSGIDGKLKTSAIVFTIINAITPVANIALFVIMLIVKNSK